MPRRTVNEPNEPQLPPSLLVPVAADGELESEAVFVDEVPRTRAFPAAQRVPRAPLGLEGGLGVLALADMVMSAAVAMGRAGIKGALGEA